MEKCYGFVYAPDLSFTDVREMEKFDSMSDEDFNKYKKHGISQPNPWVYNGVAQILYCRTPKSPQETMNWMAFLRDTIFKENGKRMYGRVILNNGMDKRSHDILYFDLAPPVCSILGMPIDADTMRFYLRIYMNFDFSVRSPDVSIKDQLGDLIAGEDIDDIISSSEQLYADKAIDRRDEIRWALRKYFNVK